jgi:hypothetical protein
MTHLANLNRYPLFILKCIVKEFLLITNEPGQKHGYGKFLGRG